MESETPIHDIHADGDEQLGGASFHSENVANGVEDPKRKGTKRIKSRFKGVFKCGKKFKAQIQTHGVQHYLGLFDTEEEAAKAYDTHARLVLGMKAKTNFDYDPRDVPDDSYLPNPSLPAPRNGADENGSKAVQLRRSYVGMKVRKKSRIEAPTPVVMSSSVPITHNPNPQSRFNLSNLSRAMQQQQAQSHLLRLPAAATPLGGLGDTLDWSKHPYTPLEINAPMGYHSLQPMNEPDWRDQIYYWTGALVYSDEERCLVWTGRWLGSFTGRPLTEEFEASHNDFRYTGPPVEKARVVHSNGIIKPVSGSYSGCYVADSEQGSDLEKFEEQHVILEFEEARTKPTNLFSVFGHGESEFGFFILNGSYDSESGVLDMTRQYLSDGDPRCSMNMPQLKEYFKRLTGQGR